MAQAPDEMFDALANKQRRYLLFTLLDESPVPAAPEAIGQSHNCDTPDHVRRIQYHHTHLPKLDEYEFINWTPKLNCIERGDRFDEIEPILDRLSDMDALTP